jgi:hypothetical protein
MRSSSKIVALILLASAGLLPVFAAKVKVVLAKDANMAQYKTYQWLPPRILVKTGIEENHPGNPILKEVVGKYLTSVGLTEVPDGADLAIQTYVLTESVPQLEAVLFGEGYNFDYGTVVASMGRYNRQGTLYVNLIDRKTKKSAWAGMSTEDLNRGTLSNDQIRGKLEETASALFKKYPLKKK